MPFPVTLNNANRVFKVMPFFDAEYLTNGYRYGHLPRSTRSSSVVTLSRPPTISSLRSLIQIRITPSVESTPGFFPSASPVMSRLTSSFTCQVISNIITTLIIHHSFTLSLQAQNLPFHQILPTLDFFYLPDCLHDNGTGPDLSCSSFYF